MKNILFIIGILLIKIIPCSSQSKSDSAFALAMNDAVAGNAEGQYFVGLCFMTGNGTSTNYAKGIYWLRKAASHNHPKAKYNIGVAYREGKGVERNADSAFYYVEQSANLEYPLAQYDLALYYDNGEVVPKDASKAFFYIRNQQIVDVFMQCTI